MESIEGPEHERRHEGANRRQRAQPQAPRQLFVESDEQQRERHEDGAEQSVTMADAYIRVPQLEAISAEEKGRTRDQDETEQH